MARVFYELMNKNDITENEIEFRKNYFRSLLESLDSEGFNDRLGRVQVCTGGYFHPNNGTHRFAWCYVNRKLFIPVIISKENIWFSERGRDYLNKLNMPLKKIEHLEKHIRKFIVI